MLKKLFKFLTRKRKAVRKTVGVTAETEQQENFMENEKTVVETEEKEVKPIETEAVEKETEKVEKVETEKEPTEEVVENTEESGNGISIDQVVTKDILADALNSINAKLDAILKENSDLKNKLAEKENEVNGMKEKYETNDFGNTAKKGVNANEKTYTSFDEYSKQFMTK